MADSGTTKPTALQRGQLRRRLRHQQRIREALLLDLGALVFELHRQGRREPELLQAKAAEVSAVDTEVRALAEALEADASLQMLSPGVAGACVSCGALISTGDRFCASCGTPAEATLPGPPEDDRPKIETTGNGAGERDLEPGPPPPLTPSQRPPPPWAALAEPEPTSEGPTPPGRGGRKRPFGRGGSES
jgi:hypothetical protein